MIALPDDAQGALAVGWATVELDRAARELAHLLPPGSGFRAAPPSVVLGARCRVGTAADDPGVHIVLLEPDTEGRLAATLARHGEGWAATWIAIGPAADPASASERVPAPSRARAAAHPGPLGEERLVLGAGVAGPHRLVVEAVPSPP